MAADSIEFVLDRPRLARTAHLFLRFTPTLKRHLHNLNRRSLAARDLSRRGHEIRSLLIAAAQRHARKSI